MTGDQGELYLLAATLGKSRMLLGKPPPALAVKGGFFLYMNQIVLADIFQAGLAVVNNKIPLQKYLTKTAWMPIISVKLGKSFRASGQKVWGLPRFSPINISTKPSRLLE